MKNNNINNIDAVSAIASEKLIEGESIVISVYLNIYGKDEFKKIMDISGSVAKRIMNSILDVTFYPEYRENYKSDILLVKTKSIKTCVNEMVKCCVNFTEYKNSNIDKIREFVNDTMKELVHYLFLDYQQFEMKSFGKNRIKEEDVPFRYDIDIIPNPNSFPSNPKIVSTYCTPSKHFIDEEEEWLRKKNIYNIMTIDNCSLNEFMDDINPTLDKLITLLRNINLGNDFKFKLVFSFNTPADVTMDIFINIESKYVGYSYYIVISAYSISESGDIYQIVEPDPLFDLSNKSNADSNWLYFSEVIREDLYSIFDRVMMTRTGEIDLSLEYLIMCDMNTNNFDKTTFDKIIEATTDEENDDEYEEV